MKNNLHSACLFLVIFLYLISGFVGLAAGFDYSFNQADYTDKWGTPTSPESNYSIWGYLGKDYNFTTKCPDSLLLSNITVIFYWDCLKNPSDYKLGCQDPQDKTIFTANKTWYKNDTYYICVGIFQNEKVVNMSYWVPIKIMKKDLTIEIQNFSLRDEREESGYNRFIDHNIFMDGYAVQNFTDFLKDDNKNKSDYYYCAYLKNDYSFNASIQASCTSNKSRQNINDTIIEVNWKDNSPLEYREYNQLRPTENTIFWNESFAHKWDKAGKKEIEVKAYYWDLLDNSKIYSNITTQNVLIINDPKNFVSSDKSYISFIIEPFSNLQNLGIFLVSAGLMILFFTYSKNKVPVKISILGIKPFYLKSVDTFIGVFIFVAGMYLYFIFGRCPWDIPFLGDLGPLPNIYFSMLYYEYATRQWNMPYFSILLGLIDVSFISIIIYRIGSPFLKGDLENIRLLRGKRPLIPLLNTLSLSLKRKK